MISRCQATTLHLCGVVVIVTASLAGAHVSVAAEAVGLTCLLSGPSQVQLNQPVQMQMTLHNAGPQPLLMLIWATPFEPQWFAPYVEVRRGNTQLPYGGAMVKRGDPSANHYLRFEVGQKHVASFDLAIAFDLKTPGIYKVQPRVTLQDVIAGDLDKAPRPRDQHTSLALKCNSLSFKVAR